MSSISICCYLHVSLSVLTKFLKKYSFDMLPFQVSFRVQAGATIGGERVELHPGHLSFFAMSTPHPLFCHYIVCPMFP